MVQFLHEGVPRDVDKTSNGTFKGCTWYMIGHDGVSVETASQACLAWKECAMMVLLRSSRALHKGKQSERKTSRNACVLYKPKIKPLDQPALTGLLMI